MGRPSALVTGGCGFVGRHLGKWLFGGYSLGMPDMAYGWSKLSGEVYECQKSFCSQAEMDETLLNSETS